MESGREGSILDAIYEDDDQGLETLGDDDGEDVDMVDADPDVGGDEAAEVGGSGGSHHVNQNQSAIENKNKKRKKKKRKRRNSGSAPNITDVNRFVINTCRHLKEKKSYLVWNAVGCLGVSAVSDLVKEVDVIQGCGGQKTADGRRFRSGGGVLWNILKTREPKAYKEIMTKGREFEKQLWQPKKKQMTKRNEGADSQTGSNVSDEVVGGEIANNSDEKPELQHGLGEPPSGANKTRVPVHMKG